MPRNWQMSDKVSILLPVYNEGAHIEACLRSIAAQDVPLDQLEVVIADGNSTDSTPQKVENFRNANPSLSVIVRPNPSRNTATGRNICLKAASGNLILNFSGHAVAAPNLVSKLRQKLLDQPEDVAAVGAAILPTGGKTFLGSAISAVLSSAMGGGNSVDSNFNSRREQFARSIAFALYRGDVVKEAGCFDEDLWCGQDAELNYRLRWNGYKILYTPETTVSHHKRDDLCGFIRQMYRYGVARALILRKFPDSFRAIHVMPTAFSLSAIAAVAATSVSATVGWGTLLGVCLFVAAAFATTVKKVGNRVVALASAGLYGVMYLSYGIGFLRGLGSNPAQIENAQYELTS